MLVTTGIWLWSGYRPTAVDGWSEPVYRARTMHRWAATTFVWDALALIALVLARTSARRQWPAAAWLLLVAVVMGFTGYLLPWDQLALRQVTVGTSIRGMSDAWGRDVRFILLGGVEITPRTLRRWAVAHVVVVPAMALLVPAIVSVVRNRRPEADGG